MNNYTPKNDDEIELVKGDVVWVKEEYADGWFLGMNQRTDMFGTFPGNFVRRDNGSKPFKGP